MRRKLWNTVLSVVMAAAMSVSMIAGIAPTTVFADDAAVEEVVTAEPAVTSSLGMFTAETSSVSVNADATVSVEFTTKKMSKRTYTKLALIEQTATDEEKDAAAEKITAVVNDDTTTTFTYTLDVDQIGEAIPFSVYQEKEGDTGWKVWSSQPTLTVNITPDVANQLIALIYVQERDEYTDKLCTASKNVWDALTDEQKAQVEEYDYYGADTGDASLDNPLNQDGIGEKELLVVSFGTSFNGSRVATIGGVEKALQAAYPEYSVRRAFTAQIIINHIQSRDNEVIDNVDQALERAVANGVKELVVQPTHLMSGAEYDEMKAEIDKYSDRIEKITYAKPLLDSEDDKVAVAKAVTAAAAAAAGYASVNDAPADTAFVFMGHGTDHVNQITYAKMQATMDSLGYSNCYIGTVEGKPATTAVENIIKELQDKGYTKVILRPLMVVAGDHANNDMAGDDEDSWKSQMTAAGLEVTCQVNGLGELEAVQQIYVAHSKAVIEPETTTEPTTEPTVDTKTEAAKKAIKATKVYKVHAAALKTKHRVKLTWKKNSKLTYYKVYRSTKATKNFKLVKTTKSTSAVIKGQKKNKVYYFKVRGYKKLNGTKVYSKYSLVVRVKTK